MKKWISVGLIFILHASAQTSISPWEYIPQVDPITDTNTSAVALPNLERTYGVSLIVRCSNDKSIYDVFINTRSLFLGKIDDSYIAVTLRFDSNKPRNEEWNRSTNKTAVFSLNPTAFLKSLRASKRFIARIYDDNEEITYQFNTNNATQAVSKLKFK